MPGESVPNKDDGEDLFSEFCGLDWLIMMWLMMMHY
jgi:hypothetical protein